MHVKRFRELLEAGRVTRRVPTRRKQHLLTSYIVQNLQSLVKRCNKKCTCKTSRFRKPFAAYNIFMMNRPLFLNKSGESYAKLLENRYFCNGLRNLLKEFWMDQRGSRLTSFDQFQSSLIEAGPDFDLLSSAEIRLETLNLKQKIGDDTVSSIIERIYELFTYPGRLSVSGGIVIASKTMHMIMPEVFIMIDHRIMKSLHNISDYYPHQDEGSWRDILTPALYRGGTLNPHPATGWDWHGFYAAALMYYKRIIREWCQKNNSDIQGFLNIDAKYGSTPARIVDKALW